MKVGNRKLTVKVPVQRLFFCHDRLAIQGKKGVNGGVGWKQYSPGWMPNALKRNCS